MEEWKGWYWDSARTSLRPKEGALLATQSIGDLVPATARQSPFFFLFYPATILSHWLDQRPTNHLFRWTRWQRVGYRCLLNSNSLANCCPWMYRRHTGRRLWDTALITVKVTIEILSNRWSTTTKCWNVRENTMSKRRRR